MKMIHLYQKIPTQNHENEQIQTLNKIKDAISHTIVAIRGDLNLTLNPLKDKKGGIPSQYAGNKY